ncbi:PAN domain-containing protein [Morus notabilis]|uniref:PAN domain-containing protein n=1 Tax=Morus notabilis TaxID=981085 RepID=W9QI76_9ROSA|nr:PAN domain-containing protein At5g03700 [Morus notabilis]EXB37770.1 PAN domain-containing protein [Morus notabilis]
MINSTNSVTQLRATQLLLLIITIFISSCTEANDTQELLKGFKARPDPSTTSFQSLLRDPTGNLSFGFLRTNRTRLSLAVLHLPSSETLWLADPTRFLHWSHKTELTFTNGSLVISNPGSRVFWSSSNSVAGDRVVLLNSSSLQIQDNLKSVVWQSFDFPGNTLVEGQNFTDAMTLISSNGKYFMRLGSDFMGLYAGFKRGYEQIYWKHRAMQAKAEIVQGKGPIYARVNPDGYLGMYQTGTEPPVDVQPFSTFQKQVNGLIRVVLEPDGNLRGYFWDGSTWVSNYQAISETCELPSPCGSYGLCKSGSGCSCIDNRTEYISGGECLPTESGSGDFCGDAVANNGFWVLRRKGVELPYNELMRYETTSSLEECEGICEKNCSCWGAVYNNASRFCYTVDYPIQTLLSVGDETKVGYFKVRKSAHKGRVGVVFRALIGVFFGAVLVFVGFIGFVVYKAWERRRGVKRFLHDDETGGVSPGPYKDLGSASFRALEMCNR